MAKRDEHLARLARRRDYLRTLIKNGEANSWDKAEESSLTWAIEALSEPAPEPRGGVATARPRTPSSIPAMSQLTGGYL